MEEIQQNFTKKGVNIDRERYILVDDYNLRKEDVVMNRNSNSRKQSVSEVKKK